MSIWTRLALIAFAALFFMGGVQLTSWERARALEKELQEAQEEMQRLHIEHRDTLDSITSAMDAREEIHERAKIQEEILQEALHANPGISDLVLPDDLRLCLQWREDGCANNPPSPGSSEGHSDPGQIPNTDGR